MTSSPIRVSLVGFATVLLLGLGSPSALADPPPTGTASISGTLSGYDGTASISAYDATTGDQVASGTTASSVAGSPYSISNLAAGSYILEVGPNNLTRARSFVNAGTPVTVADGEARTGVDALIVDGVPATVTGTVTLPAGSVSGTQFIYVQVASHFGPVTFNNASGQFTGPDGPASTYSMWAKVSPNGSLSYPFTINVPAGQAYTISTAAQLFDVSAYGDFGPTSQTQVATYSGAAVSSAGVGVLAIGDTASAGTIHLTLDGPPAPTATITGTVTDGTNPLSGIAMYLTDAATGVFVADLAGSLGGIPAAANGVYSGAGIPTGDYLLEFVDARNSRFFDGTAYVPEWLTNVTAGSTSVFKSQAVPLHVVGGETTTIPPVTLTTGGTITGTTYVAAPPTPGAAASATVATINSVLVLGIRPQVLIKDGSTWTPITYDSAWFGPDSSTFQMAGIPPGNVCLYFAEAPSVTANVRFSPTYHGPTSAVSCDGATLVPVTAGTTTRSVDTIFAYRYPTGVTPAAASIDFGTATSTELPGLTNSNLIAGDTIDLQVGTDHAGEWVSVFAHSDPTSFGGWYQVTTDGRIVGALPAALAAGQHHIVVQDSDGTVLGWDGVTVTVSSSHFSDVSDPSSTFYAYVEWMAAQGISLGTAQPSGKPLYKPVDAVSRQAMALFMYRLSGETFVPPTDTTFADVDSASPFYTAVEWMAHRGISVGTAQPSGKPLYKPTDPVSRQAMAIFLARYDHVDLSVPAVTQSFDDVPTSGPFAAAIAWMKTVGISTGTAQPAGLPLFKPVDPVSRQAMAAFLYRLAHLNLPG